MTDIELGWLAGMVDGEGCIYIMRISRPPDSKWKTLTDYRLMLAIAGSHRVAMEYLVSLTGTGTINTKKISRHNAKWNDYHEWQCGGHEAGRVIRLLRPHLIIKAEEADIAIEFDNLKKVRNCHAGTPPELIAERVRLYHALQDLKPRNIARKRADQLLL